MTAATAAAERHIHTGMADFPVAEPCPANPALELMPAQTLSDGSTL